MSELRVKQIKIPRSVDGGVASYQYSDTLMIDNYEFGATLQITGFARGRSAANLLLKDENGGTYSMFRSEFLPMLKEAYIDKGYVTAEWTFVKRGANYSLRWLGAE